MKICQVAPLFESVPPAGYGGTERVVSHLTEALVDLGHDVTLFASGDSETKAHLVPIVERSLRLDPECPDWLMWHTIMLDRVFRSPGFLRGAVVDFVHLGEWPTFNVADSAITVGAVLVIVWSVRSGVREHHDG